MSPLLGILQVLGFSQTRLRSLSSDYGADVKGFQNLWVPQRKLPKIIEAYNNLLVVSKD